MIVPLKLKVTCVAERPFIVACAVLVVYEHCILLFVQIHKLLLIIF